MAGRGRGRGRGRGLTFDVAQIGFQKGDALPAAIQKPPPLFPPLEFRPVQLSNTDADEYLLALKQEFRGMMQESDYFIKNDIKKRDVERYSDKYKETKVDNTKWEPDWSRFPEELKIKPRRKPAVAKPNLHPSRKRSTTGNAADVVKRLDELEKNDRDEDEDDDDEEQNEGEAEDEQDYDEEEHEEDNDYLVSHYDDGEEVGFQDDDDMDEGPVY